MSNVRSPRHLGQTNPDRSEKKSKFFRFPEDFRIYMAKKPSLCLWSWFGGCWQKAFLMYSLICIKYCVSWVWAGLHVTAGM